ncbi:unnamed protein product [Hymenolepis diminuta]|uniref:Uncharacterized protein n=1 Tax=Hymenolepis diminuta TaxID=6216 RepID=A0A564Z1R9_HYMDI|nr:unnamed protein product [Hymenolepis diminuta]
MCFEAVFIVLFGTCIGQTMKSRIQKRQHSKAHKRSFFRALRDQIPFVRRAPGPGFVTPH